MVLCPSLWSHREICTWNRPVSETKFLRMISGGPFLCRPRCFTADFKKFLPILQPTGGACGDHPTCQYDLDAPRVRKWNSLMLLPDHFRESLPELLRDSGTENRDLYSGPKGPKIENFNLAWKFQSRSKISISLENVNPKGSEFPTNTRVWWAARLKFSGSSLEISIPEGDLEFYQSCPKNLLT